jgi:hypothetical protein
VKLKNLEQSFRGDALYTSPTKLVEVYYIDSFEKAQSFFSNTTWCICNNREQWNILRKKGSTFYLIVNRNFSMRSKCRFVIAWISELKLVKFSIVCWFGFILS